MFNEREQKLIRLALDPGAHDGEIQNASVMVFRSLIARGIMADVLINGVANSKPKSVWEREPRYIFPNWQRSKWANMPFAEIDPSYLRWVVRVWYAKLDDEGKQEWMWLVNDIIEFFK
jgi:hypothetical protein